LNDAALLDPPELEGPEKPNPFVLKHGDMFIVSDAFGDMHGPGDGLFHNDTRLLSRLRLSIAGKPLVLLGAAVGQDNVVFTAHLTNMPLPPLGGPPMPQAIIHIERTRLIWRSRLYERFCLMNFGQDAVRIPVSLEFAADFRDMFEVRGARRRVRGRVLPHMVADDSVELGYEELDGLKRACFLAFNPTPTTVAMDSASFEIVIPPHDRRDLFFEVGTEPAGPPSGERFREASLQARYSARSLRRRGATIATSGRLFNEWLGKSRADLALLTTELPTGPFPYAGIPWFSTAFGRDAIITALQVLWLDPTLAQGVLRFLAEHQATETSRFADAAPGKIMHETRKGEMARLGELPFARYYGGVDTTPLFVMLAGAYGERTGDLDLVETLWPSLQSAMHWIEGNIELSRGGFLSYARGEVTGLANQGWKDSEDSVFHADGDAAGPIALVEVQGYAYAAFRVMADLARRRGATSDAESWLAKAQRLQAAVERSFWLDDLGTYAIALDGDDRPCRIHASNPGHLLFSGLPHSNRAERVSDQLLSPMFDTGWGIRTLGKEEARYNPMSYHNGSVWPHDTALCGAGMARYGARDGVARLLTGMFEAAVKFGMRLPELFCGFARRAGEPPVAYPVACVPQAWASGSVFMLLQACLGLRIDGWRGEIHVDRPRLPVGIDKLTVRNLTAGTARVDLTFQRIGARIAVYSEGSEPSPVPVLSRA
jgi:glycogen debranching enzyme